MRGSAMKSLSTALFSKDSITLNRYAQSHAARVGCTIAEAENFLAKVSAVLLHRSFCDIFLNFVY